MSVVIHEDKCPSCRCYVREGAEACPHCGSTWPKFKDDEAPQ